MKSHCNKNIIILKKKIFYKEIKINMRNEGCNLNDLELHDKKGDAKYLNMKS